MKYQLEFHPNPDCLSIHVDKRLTSEVIESFETNSWDKDKQPPLVRDFFGINGIEKVTLKAYDVGLTKGKVFDWDDMLSSISLILQMHLAPEEEMIEKAAPTRYYFDSVGYRRESPRATDGELQHSRLFPEEPVGEPDGA